MAEEHKCDDCKRVCDCGYQFDACRGCNACNRYRMAIGDPGCATHEMFELNDGGSEELGDA